MLSRHSSMVLQNIEVHGIFLRDLQKKLKKKFKKINLIAMWPNKNNYSKFGFNNKIIKKKYYLYKTIFISNDSLINFENYNIDNFKSIC